ncbi:hypothetical protein [Amycolatopsis sp. Hca4]|uniref:hypothetical protein n=1 Tax=Amycolatopsis sp. Hca4 TaxID=2742131 RepID=UPI00159101AB|nr:hypothetical protein [Amycolatopsis sp. Hca4]QKV76422.1 hypothetical protein HUT10_23525 [Amycolatopsis sp. Hca4]
MDRGLPAALCGLAAGAVLTTATCWLLEAAGPVEREEAVVVARHRAPPGEPAAYRLVLRTASGERLEASGHDKNFDLRPAQPVLLEISEVGRAVRAIEVDRHRVPVDAEVLRILLAALFGAGLLAGALVLVADSGRRVVAAVSTAVALGAGALPVLLLL